MTKKIAIDISMLKDDAYTGTAVYEYNLIKNLLEINKTDRFILFGVDSIGGSDKLSKLEFGKRDNVTIKVVKIPEKLLRTFFIGWQKINLPPVEFFTGPIDLFHSFNWYLPPQSKGKQIGTFYDLTPLLFPKWHTKRNVEINRFLLNRYAEKADKLVTISENSKRDFESIYGVADIDIVYPASNITETPAGDFKDLMKKFNITPDYLLSVGTIEPRKNLPKLVDAYINSGVKNQLVITGMHGWENEAVYKKISSSKANIIVTGYVSAGELKSLYENARLFIYPSLYEGFGIPVLEAMQSKVPVITSRISSLPEVGGDAAMFINPHDTADISGAIIKVLSDKDLSKRMISDGLKQSAKFNWHDSARKLNDIYQRLLT